MIKDLEDRLEKIGISISVSEKAKEYISRQGFDSTYGARPLERTIRRTIEDQLAEEILKGAVDKEDKILIDCIGDKLSFNKSL